MAIEDYIPQIFGTAPAGYEGLLGADQTQALQKTANLQGLLGAAGALAQGMSGQGSRRSAVQNILGALSGGLQGSQGAYQQGLQQYTQQQQLAQQQRMMAGTEALKLKYPDLADELQTNPAGAFRIISEREKAANKPETVVVGNVLVDARTGQPIYTGEPKPVERKTAVVNGVLVDTSTGTPIYGTPEAKPPETKLFPDGSLKQWNPSTSKWDLIASKPAGEGKTMYANTPTTDASGNLVFLPNRPGLPVVNATTGKPVDYQASTVSKPLPAIIQKAEDADYETAQNAINLASDANKYLNVIKSGAIKFGPLDKASTTVRGVFGSEAPDVTARNDFESFKTRLVNESLRLNKGTQTEGDAIRAANELKGSDSAAGAGKAINTLVELNARKAQDAQNAIIRRRKNAKLGEPDVLLDIPKFEPHVFTDADYNNLKSGTIFVDPKGIRRVKP